MARTLKLTWDKAGSRWKKIYKGRVLYFPFGTGKSDSLGYKRALEEFTRKRAEIDSRTEAQKPHRDAYEEAIGLRRNMLDWIGLEAERLDTDPDLKAWRERLLAEVGRLEADFARPSPPELNRPGGLRVDPIADEKPGVVLTWLDRLGSIRSHKRWAQDDIPAHTVATAVDEYLRNQKTRAESGQIRLTSYQPIKERLPHFRAFCGEKDASKLDEKTLARFHAHLLERVVGGMSPQYAAHILSASKTFIRQLWRDRVLEHLPRNLGSLTIKVETQEIRTFEVGEIDRLLENAGERTRLYLLLMLNCGYYQSDLAALKQSQVDWRAGTITRKRTKTETKKNVPKVTYLLWDETFRLLSKYRSDDETLALTNRNGRAVLRRPLRANDRVSRTDNITKAYQRLCDRLGIKKATPLMMLRKTSATMLERHGTFGRYAQFFLGQAPQSLTERRYGRPDDSQFVLVCRWLGLQYGLATSR
ncbi:MAG: hypothetical protein JWN86_1414 [Planctomycetota bacterium]|nr:hypothetical protein [Planctomycetota bacterium]